MRALALDAARQKGKVLDVRGWLPYRSWPVDSDFNPDWIMAITQLYAKYKHTAQCRLSVGDAQAEDSWFDLDIYSENENPDAALQEYLVAEYGNAPKAKAGVYTVEDTEGPVRVVRSYRAE